MGTIVLFTSANRGTGTSTLARAFAVEAAYSLNTKILDLDGDAAATWNWGRQREERNIQPAVPIARGQQTELGAAARSVELLVMDAPANSVHREDWLAASPLLTIVVSRASADELDHTLKYLRELGVKGDTHPQLAVALCRIHSNGEAVKARGRLNGAGYAVFRGELRQSNSFRGLQQMGRAVTESPVAYLAAEAYELIKAMQAAFATAFKL